jgi:hypothetical protein
MASSKPDDHIGMELCSDTALTSATNFAGMLTNAPSPLDAGKYALH